MTHRVDADGNYLGEFSGGSLTVDGEVTEVAPMVPEGSVEVSGPPPSGDARQRFDIASGAWLPFTPPISDYPLNRFQFEALVIAMGLSMADLETAIAGLPISAFDKAVAVSRLRNAVTYNRDHPLVEQVRQNLGLSVEAIDTAWMQAAALS